MTLQGINSELASELHAVVSTALLQFSQLRRTRPQELVQLYPHISKEASKSLLLPFDMSVQGAMSNFFGELVRELKHLENITALMPSPININYY